MKEDMVKHGKNPKDYDKLSSKSRRDIESDWMEGFEKD